jgi:guanylate kinase
MQGSRDQASGTGSRLDCGDRTATRVVVVGPDAAGKSTLVLRLQQAGYDARSCAQDHSYVPDMWRRLSRPGFLIFLDASLESIARRRTIAWGQDRLDALQRRLAHAREHCDLYVDTDEMTPEEVTEFAERALFAAGIQPQTPE